MNFRIAFLVISCLVAVALFDGVECRQNDKKGREKEVSQRLKRGAWSREEEEKIMKKVEKEVMEDMKKELKRGKEMEKKLNDNMMKYQQLRKAHGGWKRRAEKKREERREKAKSA